MTPDYKQKLNLTDQGGSYIIILYLPQSKKIVVGKLGIVKFLPGFYLYVGSARGPGGLRARLNRHLSSQSKKFWHIDYLKTYCKLYTVIHQTGRESWECKWSNFFAEQDKFSVPCLGFGASDCKCSSHLFFTKNQRDLEQNLFEFLCRYPKCWVDKLQGRFVF